MATKVNTTQTTAATNKETAIAELEKQVKEAAKLLKAEKMIKASIPKALEKHIGPTLYLGINGVSLVLPVDGKEYEIPESFKKHLTEYLDNITV